MSPKMLHRLSTEPLLHFLVLGALLFAADRYVVGSADDPRRIVIDAKRRSELVGIFEEGQGRPPEPEELQELIVQWSQNEVLYREALSMGLDRGDEMIRQRLILKLRNVLFGNIVVDPPSEAQLRSWFEENRARYDRPASFDFEQFQLPEGTTQESARELAQVAGAGDVPKEYEGGLRDYGARPRANLVALFGEEDADRLVGSQGADWVPVSTDRSWHLARVTRRLPAVPGRFDNLRSQIVREWRDYARKADLAGALKLIVGRYDILVVGGSEPAVAQSNRADDGAKRSRSQKLAEWAGP